MSEVKKTRAGMTKKEFIKRRTEIISEMLDNPKNGIYATTKAYAALDDLFDDILVSYGHQPYSPSWAQANERDIATSAEHE